MPTASVFFLCPVGTPPLASPLPGDPWEVSPFADAATATAALVKHPHAVLTDDASASEPAVAALRAASDAQSTPAFALRRPDGLAKVALARERVRNDKPVD